MRLRVARPGDEPALAELSDELGYPCGGDQIAARLRHIQSRDDHLVLVAEDDAGQPVAWVHAFVAHPLQSDAGAEVSGLVVSSRHRNGGVGLALLEAAESWARSLGFDTIHVRSNVVRERAHGFYLRHGYTVSKTSRVFQKKLR